MLAWAAFAVLLGGGPAHADEQQPDGPLDATTSLVGHVLSGATAVVEPVVSDVVAPVVQTVTTPVRTAVPAVVEPVAEAVVSAPVIGDAVAPVAAPVADAVVDAVDAATTTATSALQGAPVGQATAPVLDAVHGVPAVGELLDELGVTAAVDDVIGVLDDTAALAGGTAQETLPPVLEALEPITAPSPLSGSPSVPGEPAAVPTPATAVPGSGLGSTRSPGAPASVPLGDVSGTSAVLSASSDVPRSSAAEPGREAAPEHAGSPWRSPATPAPTSSAGPGGAGTATGARAGDDHTEPLRAWKRSPTPEPDVLPASPGSDTDVSPD